MARFRFRLQALLDQRLKLEDRLKQRVAETEANIRKEVANLKLLERHYEGARSSLTAARQADVDIEKTYFYYNYCEHIKEVMKKKSNQIDDLKALKARQQEELVEAMKDRKVVESLRDKKKEEHRLEELRQEQLRIDDMANTRYVINKVDSKAETV